MRKLLCFLLMPFAISLLGVSYSEETNASDNLSCIPLYLAFQNDMLNWGRGRGPFVGVPNYGSVRFEERAFGIREPSRSLSNPDQHPYRGGINDSYGPELNALYMMYQGQLAEIRKDPNGQRSQEMFVELLKALETCDLDAGYTPSLGKKEYGIPHMTCITHYYSLVSVYGNSPQHQAVYQSRAQHVAGIHQIASGGSPDQLNREVTAGATDILNQLNTKERTYRSVFKQVIDCDKQYDGFEVTRMPEEVRKLDRGG